MPYWNLVSELTGKPVDFDPSFANEEWYKEQKKRWDVLVAQGWQFSNRDTDTPLGPTVGLVLLHPNYKPAVCFVARDGRTARQIHTAILEQAEAYARLCPSHA